MIFIIGAIFIYPSTVFALDLIPPTGTIKINNGAAYTNSTTVTLNISAKDNTNGSGLNKMQFSNDNRTFSAQENYATTKTWALSSTDGIKTVYAKFSDKAGNWSRIASSTIRLDTIKPVTTSSGIDGLWHTNAVKVTLTAVDSGSGVDKTYYSTDGASPKTLYTGPFTISASGSFTIQYYSKDKAGNIEAIKTALNKVNIDTIPPTGAIKINNGAAYTKSAIVTLSVSAADNTGGSGLNNMQFSNDNKTWSAQESCATTKTWTLSSSDGAKTVYAKFSDKTGNWSAVVSASIIVDTVPPVIAITSPLANFLTNKPNIIVAYTVDGAAKTKAFTLIEGLNTLTIIETDAAGNSSSKSIKGTLKTGTLISASNGGTVVSQDGKVRIIIPPGVLSKDTYIRISCPDPKTYQKAAPNNYSLYVVADCQPDLIFPKDAPAKIIFTLDKVQVPGTPVYLGLYYPDSGIEIEGPSSFVASDGVSASFLIEHFSTYAAMQGMLSSGAAIGASTKTPLPDLFTGSFSHSLPISAPPGRKGVQPNLALQYRSSNPNSWTGVGWTLNTGYITRQAKKGLPTYNDATDTFTFVSDSFATELVHLADNLYQAKIEGAFMKFFKEADGSWRVMAKDGSVVYFGQTADSRETGSSGNTFNWYITKAVDNNSNYITYDYTKDQGKCYLSRVEYTGNDSTRASPKYRIDFYTEGRNDTWSSFVSGDKITTAKRLKAIEVSFDSRLVWRYELEYTYSVDTGRSLLKTFTQYTSDNKTFPVQTFTYQVKQ